MLRCIYAGTWTGDSMVPSCCIASDHPRNPKRLTVTLAAPCQVRADIAASFQRVAVAHLEERTRRACGWAREAHPRLRHLVVSGGVAANAHVRARLQVLLNTLTPIRPYLLERQALSRAGARQPWQKHLTSCQGLCYFIHSVMRGVARGSCVWP